MKDTSKPTGVNHNVNNESAAYAAIHLNWQVKLAY